MTHKQEIKVANPHLGQRVTGRSSPGSLERPMESNHLQKANSRQSISMATSQPSGHEHHKQDMWQESSVGEFS